VTPIAILKTGALGDVLRTTSILAGLRARYPKARITWVTAPEAVDLVRTHPLVAQVVSVDPKDEAALEELARRLGHAFARVLSFDDELPMCRLASRLGTPSDAGGPVSGAFLDARGRAAYTRDVAPWFDMGLLSVYGKAEADRRKKENTRSHPEIYAAMLGIEMGEPELHLTPAALELGRAFAARHALGSAGPVIGLNTGAGGRWRSKKLSVERTVELALALAESLAGRVAFLVLGGPEERARNDAILAGLAGRVRAVDGGCDNALLDFAALIAETQLVVTSDSLALHVAVALRVPVVAFFAPTSAAEIELYGRGEKVASTAPDYCSYAPDADTETLSVERLHAAVLRSLPRAD
jgi:heptosyltransferase-2